MIKLACKKCGKKGIPISGKILMRRKRNVSCEKCGTEFNYSPWAGVLINILGAVIGTLLFYLVFFINFMAAVVLWVLIAIFFSGLVMVLVPLKEVRSQ